MTKKLQPITYGSEETRPEYQVDSSTINKRLNVCGVTFALSRSSLHVRFDSLQWVHDASATILLTLMASSIMTLLVLALDLLPLLDSINSAPPSPLYLGKLGLFAKKYFCYTLSYPTIYTVLLLAAGCCIFWGLVWDWDRYAKLLKSFGWVQRLAISHFTLLKGHGFRYSSPTYPLLADVHVHVEGLSWVRIQWGRKIHPSNLTQTP